jgi:hypothetical protein
MLKDFNIKIDTFKVLKSIQIRIEAYQAFLSSKNLEKNNLPLKEELYTKIIDEDINIGIVFSLPKKEYNIYNYFFILENLRISNQIPLI